MTTNQKGAIAETAIVLAAMKLGIGVFKPLTDGERYDLIFRIGSELVRVQCKTAVKVGHGLKVPCYSARRCRDGFLKRPYTAEETDAIAAYSRELDRCYYLPLSRFKRRTYIQLRLAPTRNNQRHRINWARDFEFAVTLGAYGAVAQLGERRAGSA
jgi:hypothetical protein